MATDTGLHAGKTPQGVRLTSSGSDGESSNVKKTYPVSRGQQLIMAAMRKYRPSVASIWKSSDVCMLAEVFC